MNDSCHHDALNTFRGFPTVDRGRILLNEGTEVPLIPSVLLVYKILWSVIGISLTNQFSQGGQKN